MKDSKINYKFVCYRCKRTIPKGYLWWGDFNHERTVLYNKRQKFGRIPQELCKHCYRLEKIKE